MYYEGMLDLEWVENRVRTTANFLRPTEYRFDLNIIVF